MGCLPTDLEVFCAAKFGDAVALTLLALAGAVDTAVGHQGFAQMVEILQLDYSTSAGCSTLGLWSRRCAWRAALVTACSDGDGTRS